MSGFVGSHLAEYILENFPDVEVGGLLRWRSPIGNLSGIIHKVKMFYGDLVDAHSLRTILEKEKPDVIFHLAAQSFVDFSYTAPRMTLEANVVGTANLLEIVKDLKLKQGYDPIIHVCSSSEVYGQVKEDETPIKETNPFRPASPYAVSKVGQDMLAYQYWLSWGLKTIRTRMFTHAGPRRGWPFAESNFARQIAAIEAGLSPKVVKVGNLDSVRTLADVRDTVHAYWLLVNKCSPGEVYNIGGNETMKVGEWLKYLLSISKVKDIRVEVDPARLRPSDVTLQIPCIDKFVAATGWQPKISAKQTLEDMLVYWRNYFAKEHPKTNFS